MFEELEGDKISSRTWGDICPILLHEPAAAVLAGRPLSSQNLGPLDPDRQAVVQEVSVRILERFERYPLIQMLPMRGSASDAIPWDALGARATNVLRRQGVESKQELLSHSVRSLFGFPQAGHNTVLEILSSLVDDYVDDLLVEEDFLIQGERPQRLLQEWLDEVDLETDGSSRIGEASSQTSEVELPGDVVDAFAELVTWSVLTGTESQTLLSDSDLKSLPTRVQASRDYIMQLSAADVPRDGALDAATLLDRLLRQLDERSLSALAMRTFASEPATLEVVGQTLGVTRERVRQIIGAAESEIQRVGAEALEPLRELLQVMLEENGPASNLDLILGRYPALGREVEVVAAPAWRVLVRLLGGADVCDNWFGVPSVADVAAATHQAVDECADNGGLARIEDVARVINVSGLAGTDPLREWLEYVGCSLAGDLVSSRPLGIGEAVWLVLSEAGAALTFEEIIERLPIERAPSSVRNVLSTDSRFVRVDREAFGLTEWGGAEYVGIRALIAKALDEAGGAVDLEELVEQITRKFSVAEASVRTYAQGHPFMVRDGIVCLRESTDPGASKRPTSVRRVYRGNQEWLLRWQLTDDHARGSGYSMPSPLAVAIGLRPGQSLDLASPVDTQSVYWTGLQPAIGSIRRLMEKDGLQPGDWIFVSIADDGFFTLRRMADASTLTGVHRALALVGWDSATSTDARAVLAAALGIPGTSSWSSIVEAARAKNDEDLADAILSDPGIDIASQESHEAPVDPTDVDEIMRLLT